MARALREIARKIDALDERFGRAVSWIMLLMVLLVLPYVTGFSVLSDIMSPVLNVLVRLIVGGGNGTANWGATPA